VLIVGGNQSAGGYEIANSIRYDKTTSQYLRRTCGSSASSYTLSLWAKNCEPQGGDTTAIYWNGAGAKINWEFNGISAIYWYDPETRTTSSYRDASAWYHFVWKVSSNVGTLYVNGVAAPGLTSASGIDSLNSGNFIYLGNDAGSYSPQNGYFAEVCFIDGTALDPTSFGEYDEDSGIWKPIDVSGLSFGSNGFYLDFEDSSALGNDVSGNNNDLTSAGFTSLNQTTDTPTNNSSIINILTPVDTTVSEGNLKYSDTSSNYKGVVGTFGASSGKWYCEVKVVTVGDAHQIGIVDVDQQQGAVAEYPGSVSNGYSLSNERDVYNNNGIISGYTDWTGTYTSGDIIGIAMDLDNNKLYFSKGGQWSDGAGSWGSTTFNPATGDIPINSGITYTFSASAYNGTGQFNFGSPPFTISSGNSDGNGYGNFEYTVPSGYYALNTKNLAQYG